MLTVRDLFSGGGGMSLGLEATGGFITTSFVEINPRRHALLNIRFGNPKIYSDIREVKGDGSAYVVCGEESSRGVRLPEEVTRRDKCNGQLNPMWVEWLMGFPIGWTDLKRSETPLSPKSSK